LLNTTWEILSAEQGDERRHGEGVPGPVTRDLLAGYRELLRRECAAVSGDPRPVPP